HEGRRERVASPVELLIGQLHTFADQTRAPRVLTQCPAHEVFDRDGYAHAAPLLRPGPTSRVTTAAPLPLPLPPWLCARPTRAPSTCRSPACPRSCQTISTICAMPVAPVG